MPSLPRLRFQFVALAVLLSHHAPAQTIQLQSDGSIDLLFRKPLASVASIEQSNDLISWIPAASFDQVLPN